MSAGPSLYRRHRPRTFADVVGQEHVVRTLSHAVERDQIHHAYLFVGSRGTGKTSMAKILAASLNCDSGPTVTPCGTCESCVSIANATSLDVIEMDAASNNSVDDIRALRETVAYAPVSGKHKIYILDEAHMLSTQAWNAFLKTLEEPPPRTVFVLATTEAGKVLPTVVDRCHRFDFGRPAAEQVQTVIKRVVAKEGIAIEDGAVALIARHATGSYRDALGTLEQLVTYVGSEAIQPQDVLDVLGIADAEQLFAAVDAIVAGDTPAALRAAAQLAASGRDPGQVLRDLETHARELMTVQVIGEVPPELRVTADRDARLLTQARSLGDNDAVRLLELVAQAIEASANGAQPRIQLELVLIKAAAPEMDPSTSALLARIERLEKREPRLPASRPADPAGEQLEQPSADSSTPPPPETDAVEELGETAPPEGGQEQPGQERPDDGAAGAGAESAHDVGTDIPDFAFEDTTPAVDAAPTPEPAPDPEDDFPDSPGSWEDHEANGSDPGYAPDVTDLDLDQVIRVWPAVVEMVKGSSGMLGGMIAPAKPVAVNGTELILQFPSDAEFQRRKCEQDEHRRTTQEALRNVTGVTLTIRYELAPESALQAVEAEPEPPQAMTEDELVGRLVEEFGAKEISDQDQET